MGHDYGDPAPLPHIQDRLCEGLLAIYVKAGIGLVEHHEEGVPIKRAGKGDALPLAAGQRDAAIAKAGVITVGKMHDHVMHTRLLG